MNFGEALDAAGNLEDTPTGWKKYEAYLKWLSESDTARKEMAFEKMCRGWALGSKEFKRSLLEAVSEAGDYPIQHFEGADLQEANELTWMALIQKSLAYFNKGEAEIQSERKSAKWKVAIATLLKKQTSAPNTWIAKQLNMGVPQSVSRYSSRLLALPKKEQQHYLELITKITE